jgi:hypothetical protein
MEGRAMKRLGAVLLALGLVSTAAWSTVLAEPGISPIKFSEFFLNKDTYYPGIGLGPELQIAPRLQELKGKQVELLAYMAPVLPNDGSFFLAIKDPFGECPFCSNSFDWAGITTVFVKKGIRQEYLGGAVRIVGRLDVGKKVDESGFDSYVRIYDAVVSRYQP